MAVALPYFFSQLRRHDDSLCRDALGGWRKPGRRRTAAAEAEHHFCRFTAPFGSLCARSGQAQRLKSCPSRLCFRPVLPSLLFLLFSSPSACSAVRSSRLVFSFLSETTGFAPAGEPGGMSLGVACVTLVIGLAR